MDISSIPSDSTAARRSQDSSTGSICSTNSSSSSNKGKTSTSQRKSTSLPPETVEYLKAWMMSPDHVAHPYPTEQEKAKIMEDTGIELKQLTNWFVNNRKRFWKPRVEARLQQQQTQVQLVTFPILGSTNVTCSLSIGQVLTPETSTKRLSNQESPDKQGQTIPESSSTHNFVSNPSLIHDDASPNEISVTTNNTQANRVSDASLSGSEENASDDESNLETETEDWEDASNRITISETVDIHVLRPISGGNPTIEDVTTLSNVPISRILRSFYDIQISYSYPPEMVEDRKKIQSRRDIEIVRTKKNFLKLFLEDTSSNISGSVSKVNNRKRKRTDVMERDLELHRPAYSMKNAPNMWRSACQEAMHFWDQTLPSLEEAARLFGYSQ